MITLMKDRPKFDTRNYRFLHEPVSSIEELQMLSFGTDSYAYVVSENNPITYYAFYESGPKYWIVVPFSCSGF